MAAKDTCSNFVFVYTDVHVDGDGGKGIDKSSMIGEIVIAGRCVRRPHFWPQNYGSQIFSLTVQKKKYP